MLSINNLKQLGLAATISSMAHVAQAQEEPRNVRLTGTIVAASVLDNNGSTYLYAPSMLVEDEEQLVKFWACGGRGGDHIIYKQAESTHAFDPRVATWHSSLSYSNIPNSWDRDHACDPSVIRVGHVYYLYYGGLDSHAGPNEKSTRIGLAISADGGRSFTRQPDPVIDFTGNDTVVPGEYGIGQPTVVHAPNGYFYMMYTFDNGSGGQELRVIRSKSPDFANSESVAQFAPHLIGGWSVDMAWDRINERFVVIANGGPTAGGTLVLARFYDTNFRYLGGTEVELETNFAFGEGLAVLRDWHGNLRGRVDYTHAALTVAGATVGTRGPYPKHITGPVRVVTIGSRELATRPLMFRPAAIGCIDDAQVLAFASLNIDVQGFPSRRGRQVWAVCDGVGNTFRWSSSADACEAGFQPVIDFPDTQAAPLGAPLSLGRKNWTLCARIGADVGVETESCNGRKYVATFQGKKVCAGKERP